MGLDLMRLCTRCGSIPRIQTITLLLMSLVVFIVIINGMQISTEEIIKNLYKVTKEDVINVAQKEMCIRDRYSSEVIPEKRNI